MSEPLASPRTQIRRRYRAPSACVGSRDRLSDYDRPIDDPLFSVGVVVMGVLVLGIFLALGKWYPGSGADVLDWKPTRSYEDEIQLEMDDVDQMIEAQNERRRRSGRPEISEDEVRADVDAEQREQERRAAEFRQSGEEG